MKKILVLSLLFLLILALAGHISTDKELLPAEQELTPSVQVVSPEKPEPAPEKQELISAASIFDAVSYDKFTYNDCEASLIQENNEKALKLRFGSTMTWPGVVFNTQALSIPFDWSGYTHISIVVTNPNDFPVNISIRVDSTIGENKILQAGGSVDAGSKTRLSLPLGADGVVTGIVGQPPINLSDSLQNITLNSDKRINLNNIQNFRVFVSKQDKPIQVVLHSIDLISKKTGSDQKFVDRFGQYLFASWPGKLSDEAEFKSLINDEKADLAAHPQMQDRNAYGGWKDGPELAATGSFRVQKVKDKWWIVDPEGRLFWSSGIDCVGFNVQTVVQDREGLFSWLPDENDREMSRFYQKSGGKKLFDFFEANLYRKYGNDYRNQHIKNSMERLISWGFNTIGNWSDSDTWKQKKVPYTIPVNYKQSVKFTVKTNLKAGMGVVKNFPDVYSPDFPAALDKSLKDLGQYKNDPWLLGVFIDNELPWTNGNERLSSFAMQLDSSIATKIAAVKYLEEKYSDINKFNSAWGWKMSSWEDLYSPLQLKDRISPEAEKDLREIDYRIAEKYYKTCSEAVKRNLPGKMYLGSRFSSSYNDEVVKAAAKYCDIVSFNVYKYLPDEGNIDELAYKYDMPVLIGEFHFGALDRGMFSQGLRKAESQKDRAEKYVSYIEKALKSNWFVGAHWFQYVDQPLTGRPDGENYNIGFVNVTDTPYPEMREAARHFNARLYSDR